jgi:hypothetical protein
MEKTVVLYDPIDNTGLNGTGFHVLVIDDTLDEYHRLIGCDTIAGSHVYGLSVFVDDEALLKDPTPPVSVVDYHLAPAIFGRIVFVGHPDKDGETRSLTEGDIDYIISSQVLRYYTSTGKTGHAIRDPLRR